MSTSQMTGQATNHEGRDHANDNTSDRRGEGKKSSTWRAEKTALGQLLCCTEDIVRATQCCIETERNSIESESLVRWAESASIFLDWESFRSKLPSAEELPGGVEHQVWAFIQGEFHRVLKATKPPQFGIRGSALLYVQNALWANHLFGG